MRPAAIQPMGLLRFDPSSPGILGPCSSLISVVPSLFHPISDALVPRPRAPCGSGDDLTTVSHVHRRFLTIPDDGRFNRRRNNSLRPDLRPAATGPGAPQAAYRPPYEREEQRQDPRDRQDRAQPLRRLLLGCVLRPLRQRHSGELVYEAHP